MLPAYGLAKSHASQPGSSFYQIKSSDFRAPSPLIYIHSEIVIFSSQINDNISLIIIFDLFYVIR